jgi:hypothetical protein
MSELLKLAECYYAVAHDLVMQGERAIEIGRYLGAMADRMCEQNVKQTAMEPAPEPKGCNHYPGQGSCAWCTEATPEPTTAPADAEVKP